MSIALIGTSSRWSPSLSTMPSTMPTATTTPRLHQVSETVRARTTATRTPSTTLATRCRPDVRLSYSVTWTTSSAVSGARIGAGSCDTSGASRNATTAANTVFAVRTPPKRIRGATESGFGGSTRPGCPRLPRAQFRAVQAARDSGVSAGAVPLRPPPRPEPGWVRWPVLVPGEHPAPERVARAVEVQPRPPTGLVVAQGLGPRDVGRSAVGEQASQPPGHVLTEIGRE